MDIAEKIGTYETSIQPYEDCCTIFVAKQSGDKAESECDQALRSEAERKKLMSWLKTAIETTEVLEIQ